MKKVKTSEKCIICKNMIRGSINNKSGMCSACSQREKTKKYMKNKRINSQNTGDAK